MKKLSDLIYIFLLFSWLFFSLFVEFEFISILLGTINILTYIYIKKAKEKISKNEIIFSYVFSFLTLILLYLIKNDGLSLKSLLYSLIGAFNILFIIYFIIISLVKGINKLYKMKFKNLSDKQFFIRCFLIIFILWLPVFLAYFPGIFAYDVPWQIRQSKAGVYTTHHPLVHTLILNYFYNLTPNHSIGISIYSIVQMLFFDFALSFELLFVHRYTKSKMNIIYILWFALVPIFSILAISVTKDIYFSGFFIIFMTIIGYFEIDKKYTDNKKYIALFIISCIGVALFRNNGFYVILLGNIIYIFLNKKNRNIVLSCVTSILLIIIFSNLLSLATLASGGSKNEMLSIPYQQIARVYKYENLSDNEKVTIEKIIPDVKEYGQYVSDPIKTSAKGSEHAKELIKIYSSLMFKYPIRYLEAFIYNNMGYLYIFDKSNAEIYGSGLDKRQGYLLTDTKKNLGVKHTSLFPWLEKKYENLISANTYQKNGITFLLYSFSLYLWIILYCFIKKLFKRNIIICIYIVLYILTMFLGPCALVRYALPCVCCLPMIITLCLIKPKKLTFLS